MAFIQQRIAISSFQPSRVNTKPLLLLRCATGMEAELVTEIFNKGYIEA